MIKLRIVQKGQPEVRKVIEGSSVMLGRQADCDIVVAAPFISKHHVRILQGLVVVDLGSANGTYLAGERIQQACLLDGRPVWLGREDVQVFVESEPQGDATIDPSVVEAASAAEVQLIAARSDLATQASEFARIRTELERTREKNVALAEEVVALKENLSKSGSRQGESLTRLERDNADLRERLVTLKGQVEGRQSEAAESLQVQLARKDLESVQARNIELTKRLEQLEHARVEATSKRQAVADPGLLVRISELEASIQTRDAKIRDLEKQMGRMRPIDEMAPKAAPPASALFVQLQRELTELRAKVAGYESARSADPSGSGSIPSMFFKLQNENAALKRRVAELEVGVTSAERERAASLGGDKGWDLEKLNKENAEMARRLVGAEQELLRLRNEVAKAASSPRSPTPPPPVRAQAPAPIQFAASGGGILRVARALVERDVENLSEFANGPPDEFLALESLRFMRHAERVVTRYAGHFIQLYQNTTFLPDMQGNLRMLTGEVLAQPGDARAREALRRYIDELGRWLVASLAAYREGATLFGQQIKDDLAEAKLAGGGKKMLKTLQNAELWERANAYLKELSRDTMEERIEKLARSVADNLMKGPPRD